jgi:hypothetical protein
MKAPLIFALIPAAMGLHVLLAAKFAVYDRNAIMPLAVSLLALGGLAAKLRMDTSTSMWVLNITGWLLLAGFVWWTHSYSNYASRGGAPTVGSDLVSKWGDLVLVDAEGEPFDLPAAVASKPATLLLFYRGYW